MLTSILRGPHPIPNWLSGNKSGNGKQVKRILLEQERWILSS
jgi:hypothetical protein